jgi:uncharacterized protein
MHDLPITPLLGWLRARLEALYGERLDRIVLFGSHARGDARPGSDVDVAVVLRGDVDAPDEVTRTANIVADAVLGFGRFVSVFPVSEGDFDEADREIIRAVRGEGVSA